RRRLCMYNERESENIKAIIESSVGAENRGHAREKESKGREPHWPCKVRKVCISSECRCDEVKEACQSGQSSCLQCCMEPDRICRERKRAMRKKIYIAGHRSISTGHSSRMENS